MPRLTISVVIPTRNRSESLARLLAALSRQDRTPDEVLIVDASDRPADERALGLAYPTLRIACLHAAPSVCAQRNAGIRRALGSHILLCDDDVEPPPEYVGRLEAHLERERTTGVATGIWAEGAGADRVFFEFRVPSFRSLLLARVFQLTVWGDVEAVKGTWLSAMPLEAIKRWYRGRGNTWSLAGWPLVTQVRAPVVRTTFYSLGAALVRRDWLIAAPYDDRLSAHGIGDHYGVALKFPGEQNIAVLTDLVIEHHRASENRPDAAAAHFERVLALDYFMRTDRRFSRVNRRRLVWSLLGLAATFARSGRRDFLRSTVRAIPLVARGKNPLLSQPWRSPSDLSRARTRS